MDAFPLAFPHCFQLVHGVSPLFIGYIRPLALSLSWNVYVIKNVDFLPLPVISIIQVIIIQNTLSFATILSRHFQSILSIPLAIMNTCTVHTAVFLRVMRLTSCPDWAPSTASRCAR